MSDLQITININFQMVAVFLILYDIEFVFLICLVMNLNNVNSFELIVFTLFVICIVYSLYYD